MGVMSRETVPNQNERESRVFGPKRLGLFGHRAVGKTTLLAMLYREASTGRLAETRLAAGDAKTAQYLADKIAQIEAGEPPAGTLSETELALRLYRRMSRHDLIVKDYQGEHVGLGSEEPIQEFLADCDAVWLCLDPEGTDDPAQVRRRQQEVETLLERYLERSDDLVTDRPVAIVVTKYDRVRARDGDRPVEQFVADHFGMTEHLLARHVPRSAVFAVSSFGPGAADASQGGPPAQLEPEGLGDALAWMAEQLHQRDLEHLQWLNDHAPHDLHRQARWLDAYERHHPRCDRAEPFRERLEQARRRRFRGRLAAAIVLVGLSVAGLAGYDAWAYQNALAFERLERTAPAVAQRWADLRQRHPSLAFFYPGWAREARQRADHWRIEAARQLVDADVAPRDLDQTLAQLKRQTPELADQVQEVEANRQRKQEDERWQALLNDLELGQDPPATLLERIAAFLQVHPDSPRRPEALRWNRDLLEQVRAERVAGQRRRLEAITREADDPDSDLSDLIARLNAFLESQDDPDPEVRADALQLRDDYRQQRDLRDIQRARDYSQAHPRRFANRLARYQDYLEAHNEGGLYVGEALEARTQILQQWDDDDYRRAYDHWLAHRDDLAEIAGLLRAYLRDHPEGRQRDQARSYLDWYETITTTQGYRVTLRSAQVDSSKTKFLAGSGPDLTVRLTVAGISYGTSPVVKDNARPIWHYTFARPVRWKVGDPILIEVIDKDWDDTVLLRLRSASDDPLSMTLLSGKVRPARSRVVDHILFDSDFRVATLTPPEPLP